MGPKELDRKLELLKQRLGSLGKVVVAFSGGVDSSLLLKVAKDVLGNRALGLLIDSPLHPPWELERARDIGRAIGARVHEITVDELGVESIKRNDPDRCYHCKRYRFSRALEVFADWGVTLVEGSNLDDLRDYRPGLKAIKELGVRSLFIEVGLGKREIRALARRLGLPNWDEPSSACLATRIPYGVHLKREVLEKVAASEKYLMDLGFKAFRVRYHGELARLEFPREVLPSVLGKAEEIVMGLKVLGFPFVCLDLEGYRASGLSFGGGQDEGKGVGSMYQRRERDQENPGGGGLF